MSGYLLDANVLITPHKQYSPFDFAPSFWEQLANVLRRKDATILRVVSKEILNNWARDGVADPWLIATAMDNGYKIVTNEQPSGNLSRKNLQNNSKIPDVAKHFHVQCISLFDFMRAMNFRM